MKINLISKKENLLKIDGESIILDQKPITINKDSQFIIESYPLFKNLDKIFIPFALKFYFKDKQLMCNSDFVNIINFNSFFEVEILSCEIFKANSQILLNELSFNFQNENYTIKIFSNCLNNLVISTTVPIFKATLSNVSDCALYKLSNFIIVNYTNEKSNVLIYDIKNSKICFDFEIEQFEINNNLNQLYVIKKLNDSLNHGEVLTIDLSNEFKIIDSYLTYLEDVNNSFKQFNDFIFFDCLKAKNFNKARTYLTQELNECVSNETLEAYFLKYKTIRQADKENQFYLIPSGKNVFAHLFEFEKKDNLINNIKSLYKQA